MASIAKAEGFRDSEAPHRDGDKNKIESSIKNPIKIFRRLIGKSLVIIIVIVIFSSANNLTFLFLFLIYKLSIIFNLFTHADFKKREREKEK